jgi:hypothetical protein
VAIDIKLGTCLGSRSKALKKAPKASFVRPFASYIFPENEYFVKNMKGSIQGKRWLLSKFTEINVSGSQILDL